MPPLTRISYIVIEIGTLLKSADGMGTVTTQTRLAAAAFAFCAFRYPAGGRAVVGIFAVGLASLLAFRGGGPDLPRGVVH